MLVQLYGQFGSQNSNAIVSRGIACALHKHGLDVQIYDPAGVYNGLWEDIPTGMSPGAEVGIFVGYPPESLQFLSGHELRVGCFIAESASLPAEWGAIAAACDLVCVPSRWNAMAFVRAGCSPKKLQVMPHGLHPVYAKPGRLELNVGDAARYAGDAPWPRFLHIAGAPAFRERKGTGVLIRAFGELAKEQPEAHLTLRCGSTDPALVSAIKRADVIDQVTIIEEGPLEPAEMRRFLCSGWDALVLPSRAEAFGLCAIEARAVGLPVILTHCSGHRQHAEKWDTVIEHGPDAMIKVNGIPNGIAPTVRASSILVAMREYIENRHIKWVMALKGANGYFNNNSWRESVRPLARWLRAHKRRVSRPGLHI
jgi:glycosyltransferase involved in cell wall biosynthesis